MAIVAVAVAVGLGFSALRGADPKPVELSASPVVGGDLHAVTVINGRRFVSGHGGAAYSDADGRWLPISTLEGKDAMGWAGVPEGILVGGHEGLFVSTDGGVSFSEKGETLPVTDVHALGAAGSTVYVASPQGGMFVSTDAGDTFRRKSDIGGSFMGTMLVDPNDTEHVLAPDMTNGVVETHDGALTWQVLGGPAGAMSVAWDPGDHDRILATGMNGTTISSDAGQSWQPVQVPDKTTATTFDSQGRLVAATLSGDHAQLYVTSDMGATWTRA